MSRVPAEVPEGGTAPGARAKRLSFSRAVRPVKGNSFIKVIVSKSKVFLLSGFLMIRGAAYMSVTLTLVVLLLPGGAVLFVEGASASVGRIVTRIGGVLRDSCFHRFAVVL